jgi:hypothetical protein
LGRIHWPHHRLRNCSAAAEADQSGCRIERVGSPVAAVAVSLTFAFSIAVTLALSIALARAAVPPHALAHGEARPGAVAQAFARPLALALTADTEAFAKPTQHALDALDRAPEFPDAAGQPFDLLGQAPILLVQLAVGAGQFVHPCFEALGPAGPRPLATLPALPAAAHHALAALGQLAGLPAQALGRLRELVGLAVEFLR